jgi:hypothetical protein
MKKELIKYLTEYLSGINPEDKEELLIAMPAIAVMKQLKKYTAYDAVLQKIPKKKIDEFLYKQLKYLSIQAHFDDDRLLSIWRYQQIHSLLQEYNLKMSKETKNMYDLVSEKIKLIMFIPEAANELKEFIEDTGIPKKKIAPCINTTITIYKSLKRL